MLASGQSLLLIGCGKMGGALLSGWLDGGLDVQAVQVVEPFAAAAQALSAKGVKVRESVEAVPDAFAPAVVVLAVKPQQMDPVIEACARFMGPETVFLSIAAGKSIGYFEAKLGGAAAVVRAMPNTPAAVGRGISVLVGNARANEAQRATSGRLLSAVGEVAWIEDEALMDPVTAVSGGGPAYVFLLIETLAQAGVEAGLPAELAMQLSRVTVTGAGELARLSDQPAARLRENVTSPGGTTLEALKVLMAPDGLQALMTRAIAEATRRSRELDA